MESVIEESPAGYFQAAMKTHRISPFMILRGTMYLLSLNLLVFLRRGFGERVAGDLCVACGFAWLCLRLMTAIRLWLCPHGPQPLSAQVFPYLLCGATLWHLAEIWLRRRKPATIHSLILGRPLGVWRLLRANDLMIQRYVQPIACAGLAVAAAQFDRVLGWWMFAAAVAVFIQEQVLRFSMRRRVLDTIDGRIDSQNLYERVQERLSPQAVAGAPVPVTEVSQQRRRKAGKLKSMVARLDPALRQMIEPVPQAPKKRRK